MSQVATRRDRTPSARPASPAAGFSFGATMTQTQKEPSNGAAVRFVRYAQLSQRGIPYSRTHLARLEKAGKFPKHIRLSEHTTAWLASEIDDWAAARSDERGLTSPLPEFPVGWRLRVTKTISVGVGGKNPLGKH
jgi:prophage regulatory protein